ncbi:hypothetical protein [Candidatus Glomeribacter gigasporarum]|uniref:hypothetical protein n=1 Tax=Candidatus Glomeribacter gigasporarum TaxID=132144 RepID=UPI000312D800|nr:hypothetical protein [Candidatus Glomeribacter gigasporarum]
MTPDNIKLKHRLCLVYADSEDEIGLTVKGAVRTDDVRGLGAEAGMRAGRIWALLLRR